MHEKKKYMKGDLFFSITIFLLLIYEFLHRTILPFKIIVALVTKVKFVSRV